MIDKLHFYFIIRSHCDKLLGDLSFYETGSIDPKIDTLRDLILVNEKFDRLLEVLKLFSRADEKLQGISLARVSDRSPLKVLQFLKKADVLRTEIIDRETKKWSFDNSETRFEDELRFMIDNDDSLKGLRDPKRNRVQYL